MSIKDKILLNIIYYAMKGLSPGALDDLVMSVIFANATVVDMSNEGVQRLIDELEDGPNDPELLN